MASEKEVRLGTEPLPKLMLYLIIPSVLAQFVNSLYSVVDRMYIGHIDEVGELALAGVGVCSSLMMIITAINSFVGSGASPLAAISLGKGEKEKSEKILGNSVSILLLSSILLTIAFYFFSDRLLLRFGASDKTIIFAKQYFKIYIIGIIFNQLTFGLNSFINIQGYATTSMLTVLIGAITNIILDPVFIFGFNMGVRGAALATVMAQAASAVWVVSFLLYKSKIKIRKKNLIFENKILIGIFCLGITPFIMHFTESIVAIVLNSGLQRYGNDMYVGSLSVITSVFSMLLMPVWGVTNGVQAIISYNYGAKNMERVRKACISLIAIAVTMTTIISLVTVLFPKVFVQLFNDDPSLVEITGKMMPIYFAGVWAFGAQTSCQTIFLSMGKAKISMFLALLRKVILLIPLALILPHFLGVVGIYVAQPIADIVASLTTFLMFCNMFRNVLRVPKSSIS